MSYRDRPLQTATRGASRASDQAAETQPIAISVKEAAALLSHTPAEILDLGAQGRIDVRRQDNGREVVRYASLEPYFDSLPASGAAS